MSDTAYIHVWMTAEQKRPYRLGSNGSLTRLRIHAVRFDGTERAQSTADRLAADNPGVRAKAYTPRPKKG